MPENVYFLKKKLSSRHSLGGLVFETTLASAGWDLCPQILVLVLPLTDIALSALSSAFLLELNLFYYFEK